MLTAAPVVEHEPGAVGLEAGSPHGQVGDETAVGAVDRRGVVGVALGQQPGFPPTHIRQPDVVPGADRGGHVDVAHKRELGAVGAQAVVLETAQGDRRGVKGAGGEIAGPARGHVDDEDVAAHPVLPRIPVPVHELIVDPGSGGSLGQGAQAGRTLVPGRPDLAGEDDLRTVGRPDRSRGAALQTGQAPGLPAAGGEKIDLGTVTAPGGDEREPPAVGGPGGGGVGAGRGGHPHRLTARQRYHPDIAVPAVGLDIVPGHGVGRPAAVGTHHRRAHPPHRPQVPGRDRAFLLGGHGSGRHGQSGHGQAGREQRYGAADSHHRHPFPGRVWCGRAR